MNKKTIGYISLVALLSITCLLSLNLYFKQRTAHDKVNIGLFPHTMGDWKGRDLEMTEKEYRILETRNILLREYTNSLNEELVLFIVYSETNRSVFHPPEVCLIGSGIEIVDKKIETIDCDKKLLSVNKLYTEKGDHKILDLYCYKAGNLYTDNYYLQQAYFALHQLLGKRVKGATIRVSMPIRENEGATLATLKNFLEESARIIDNL